MDEKKRIVNMIIFVSISTVYDSDATLPACTQKKK